jgi:hypothetical protein
MGLSPSMPELILQVRAALDDVTVSIKDRKAFLEDLTAALADPDAAAFRLAAAHRQPWARVMLSAAGFLLEPAPESPAVDDAICVPNDGDEEEDFLLTESEAEIWQQTRQEQESPSEDSSEQYGFSEQGTPEDVGERVATQAEGEPLRTDVAKLPAE